MFLGYTIIIQQYNQLLEQNKKTLKIIKWTKGEMILSTGAILQTREIRKFRSRCSSPVLLPHIDNIYTLIDICERDLFVKGIQKQNASIKNKQYWDNLPDIVKTQKQEHMRVIQATVNYYLKPVIVPWNKGKAKDTDDRLAKNSINKQGNKNPMYGTTWTTQQKLDKSEWVKNRIINGIWTPNVHNSRTHWQSYYKDKKFRSSWEAMYASIHPEYEYEQIRIPYDFNNKKYVYIVDFVDNVKKVLIEIKPTERLTDLKTIIKIQTAIEWGILNGYTFQVISQQYFIDNFKLIDFDNITVPNLRQKISRIKYETNKPK